MSEKLEYAQLVTAQSIAQQTLFQEKMLERQRVLEALRAPPAPAHARGRFQRVHFTRSDMQTMADKQLKLCPIRLDLDFDGYKLRDTLVWNLHDRVVDPTDFAKTTCLDLGLPTGFVPLISTSIREQLEDHFQHAPACLDPKSDPQGNGGIDNTIDLPELRILIKLDITIDHNTILDRFEWDLACPRNNPERFAEQMVRELGLVDEFKYVLLS